MDNTSPLPNDEGQLKKSLHLVRYLSEYHQKKWSTYHDDQEIFVQQLPKIELHVHFDGSFDPDFLFQFMVNNPDSIQCLPVQADLPWDPDKTLPVRSMVENCRVPRDYHNLCTCRGYRSLKEMLNCFEIFLPLVRRNLALIEQLAYDFCQRQWEQHVVYTEVRYSPFLLADAYMISNATTDEDARKDETSGIVGTNSNLGKVDGVMVFDAVTRGLRQGCEKFGITVNQILSAITWRPDWAHPTLDIVIAHHNDMPCATVGIDIAAGEEHFDQDNFPNLYKDHYDMIQMARQNNIPITIHAGEATTKQALDNIRRAITEYGACRIGHGYRMTEDDEMMRLVRESGVHVEVCPTSSNETGGWMYQGTKDWTTHPCITMLHHNVSFSLSSDDPAVFHTSLAWQYRLALVKMGITEDEIVKTNLAAIDAAFCSLEEKQKLRDMLRKHLDNGFRRSYRRSVSESFVDRVYVTAEQKI